MNMGNPKLHMWIITTFPSIVHIYEQFDDFNHFHPIELDCAIHVADSTTASNNLTVVVTYTTRYIDAEIKPMLIYFGLGESVSINNIIDLPIIRKWKLILNVDAKLSLLKHLELILT